MANFNLNKVILGGRLTADPELKQTTSGIPVCSFTLAVNRRFQKDGEQTADFITCQAWRSTAEFISKYFGKGSSLCVVGSIQIRSWTDQNNQKRYATEVVVDEAMFVDSKNDTQQAEMHNPTNYIPEAYTTPQVPNFEDIKQDDDLPF
jgi:single-strand DNA-binding protein